MEAFFQSVLSDFIAGLVLLLLSTLAGFLVRTIRRRPRRPDERPPEGPPGLSVAAAIDDFIQRQRVADAPQGRPYVVEERWEVVIEERYGTRGTSDGSEWAILFAALAAAAIADAIWSAYRFTILAVLLVAIGFGVGSSLYYLTQLRRMQPPYRLEDYIWSIGGATILALGATTSLLAVYHPLYPQTLADQFRLGEMFIHLGQLLGMGLLFLSVITTMGMQVAIAWIYGRALNRQSPPRFLIRLWETNLLVFTGIAMSAAIAFVLGTGLFANLGEPSSQSVTEATRAAAAGVLQPPTATLANSPSPQPSDTESPTATVTQVPSPSATNTPTPQVTWKPCINAPESRIHVGDRAFVSYEPPDANNVRDEPNWNTGTIIGQIVPGEMVDIIDGPKCNNRVVWWLVRSLEKDVTGWTVEGDSSDYWLVPAP